jgi:hypothetical protein
VIYLDSSVALAKLLAEPCDTPNAFWRQSLVSSRLLEYEIWTRVHALRLAQKLEAQIYELIDLVKLVEMSPLVLARALEAFPVPLRTLDTLHLATVEYLRDLGEEIALASFDSRLLAAARALDVPLHDF